LSHAHPGTQHNAHSHQHAHPYQHPHAHNTAIPAVALTPNLLEDGPVLIDQVVEIGTESSSWLWGFGAIIIGFGVFAFIPKLWRRD
jgi:hypothetical protein